MKAPKQAALFVTSKCNQRCTYCATAPSRAHAVPDMSGALVDKLMRTFPTLRSVGIGGGEPLLNKNIVGIVKTCMRYGVGVTLSTNGTLVDKYRKLPWSRITLVNVSMTEATVAAYKARAGVDMFDRVVAGVQYLQAHKAPIVLSFVIERDNADRIVEYIELARLLGVRAALQSICPITGQYDEFWDRAIDGDDEELMRVIEVGVAATKAVGVTLTQRPYPVYRNRPGLGCRMALNHISVDGAGNAALCCRGPGPRPEMGTF